MAKKAAQPLFNNLRDATPLVPWIGGKRRLAPEILPLFPEHERYVEPFCGAAALFFLKEPAKAEVLNDINGDLVCLYRVVQHHLDEFVRQFRWALTSRQMFEWLQETPPATLTDIQRAARFFYLQKLAFGSKVAGQSFGVGKAVNLLRLEEELSAAHMRLHRVTIEHLPWAECVTRYSRAGTLIYMDPPYWGTEGYGVEFGLQEYDRMAELMRSMQASAIVSVNDIPEMRQAFKGLPMRRVSLAHTVGGAHHGRGRGELIIRNF